MPFEGMPAGDPHLPWCAAPDLVSLEAQWPGCRRYPRLAAMDDWAVEDAVKAGHAPEWIIDGLEIVRRLGGEAFDGSDAPDGVPLVVKPCWNPSGLAIGARLGCRADMTDTDMAQHVYEGQHTSTDVAVLGGTVMWTIDALGRPDPSAFGRFTSWDVPPGGAERWDWLAGVPKALPDYSGVLNVEAIGGRITEAHFRPSLELFPLYGEVAVDAVVAASLRRAPTVRPYVQGGWLDVVPRQGATVMDCSDDLGEWSWRRQLVYRPSASQPPRA